MALSDTELWAAALHVQRQHGDKAPAFIAERISALALAGDGDGIAAWKGIAHRLDQLQDRTAPRQ